MRRAYSLVLASLALPLACINAQSIVAVDPNGQLCSPTQTVCYRTAQFGPSSLGLVSVTCPVTSVIGGQPLTSGQSSMKGLSSTNGLSLTTGQPSITTRSTTTSATVSATLTLGAGLPLGTIYNLPNTPILLAYTINIPGLQPRQAGSARASVFGYASGSGFEGSSVGDCAYATRFSLINGTLQNMAGEFLGKNNTMDALISPWPYFNNITTLFSFVDGFFVWNSPDQGKARFYRCGGVLLYAVFPNSPPTSCLPIIIGGISDSACGVDLSNPVSTTSLSRSPASTNSISMNSSMSATATGSITTTQATSSTLSPYQNTTFSDPSITTSSTDTAVVNGGSSTDGASSTSTITSPVTSASSLTTSTSSSNLTSSLDLFSTISSIVSSFNTSTSLSDTPISSANISTSQSTITTGLNITIIPTITITPLYLNTTISSTSSTDTTATTSSTTTSTDTTATTSSTTTSTGTTTSA